MKQNPRKHILLIVLLAGTLLPLRTGAQSSIEHLYKTLTGDGERLCADSYTGNSIISYNCHEMYTPIGFIYHKQGDTTSFRLSASQTQTISPWPTSVSTTRWYARPNGR